MSRTKRIVRITCLAAALSAMPLALSPDGGVRENQACAQNGTCCPEPESTCVIGSFSRANACYKAEGPCQNQT